MTEHPSSSKFPEVPQKLWQYYDRLLRAKPKHKLVEAIERLGYDKTWREINKTFKFAEEATGIDPDTLCDQIGFKVRDLDDSNFQAMLGILRSINMLHQIGFQELQPLPPKKSHKEVDVLGKFGNQRFAVEIFRSSEKAYRYPDHNKPGSNPTTYIARRYREKRPQLDASIQKHGCDVGMLVIVMDSSPMKELVEPEELLETTLKAYLEIGSPPHTHLLIFTGLANIQGENEYAIYPPLNQS